MGQYHAIFNLDKKQFLSPGTFGCGLKLLEHAGYSVGGPLDALHLLLACSNGRGGGDFQSESPLIGSWAGDRIATIGDYATPEDLPQLGPDGQRLFDAGEIYNRAEGEWTDIGVEMIPIMEREYELVYIPSPGWGRRVSFDRVEGYTGSHGIGDRTIMIGSSPADQRSIMGGKSGVTIPASHLNRAIKAYAANLPGDSRFLYSDEKIRIADLNLVIDPDNPAGRLYPETTATKKTKKTSKAKAKA